MPSKKHLEHGQFDDLIIGASPLMLLQAIFLGESGRSVCVVHREQQPGGCWQTAKTANGEVVEIACHVIEAFPGVYEVLEEMAGVPFVELDHPPVRINENGLVFPYFSKSMFFASGIRMVLGYLTSLFDLVISKKPNQSRYINFRSKLWSWFRYQTPILFSNTAMKGPRDGYSDFLYRLAVRSKKKGVMFRVDDVTELVLKDNVWIANLESGERLYARHVHSTSSTNLRQMEPGHFKADTQQFIDRTSVVVEVPSRSLLTRQSYVAFWGNEKVSRVSRIDAPAPNSSDKFLVELSDPQIKDEDGVAKVVREALTRAKIIRSSSEYRIISIEKCSYNNNVNQMPAGEIDKYFWCFYSYGNLAAGVARWLRTNRLPQDSLSSQ